jgi:hypothetical protein
LEKIKSLEKCWRNKNPKCVPVYYNIGENKKLNKKYYTKILKLK